MRSVEVGAAGNVETRVGEEISGKNPKHEARKCQSEKRTGSSPPTTIFGPPLTQVRVEC